MQPITQVRDFVVLFGAAVLVLLVSRRIRVPSVVGFLLTGILVGPHGLRLIADARLVQALAELGVVFLLFVIGLELSPVHLRPVLRTLLVGGGLQVLLSVLAGTGAALLLGFQAGPAVLIGFLVSVSSSAIVLRLYEEARWLGTPRGQQVTGVLLLQDVAVVPMLVAIPALGGRGSLPVAELVLRLGQGVAIIAAAFALGRYVLPRVLGGIVRSGIRELLVLGALFACLGAGWITEHLGLSMALGAFLAGLLVAETDFRPQVMAETVPLRDVFNSVFFMSIGMLLDLPTLRRELVPVLAVTLAVVAGKSLLALLALLPLRRPLGIAVGSALSLAQLGEFSFVLLLQGQAHGLVDQGVAGILLAAAVLTMLATPLLVGAGSWLGTRVGAGPGGGLPHDVQPTVLVVGFGLNGRHVARVLKEGGVPYVVVDANGRSVAEARARGEPIVYGDASRRILLERCGVTGASIAVIAISDPDATLRVVRVMRELSPSLYIIARTQHLQELEPFRRAGADQVVAQEFEASIEIVTRVLARLHVPRSRIDMEARLLREAGYEMLRQPGGPRLAPGLERVLAMATTDIFIVGPEHRAAGLSIRDMGLRQRTGASVIAVVRDGQARTNPSPDFRLETGDSLVLVGSHEEVERAFRELERGRTEG